MWELLMSVVGAINEHQIIPWLAGFLWIGWLVAVLTLICVAHLRVDLSVQRRALAIPFVTYIVWQGLILITLGTSPLVKREDIIQVLRILNLFTAIMLWRWLILYVRINASKLQHG
jgi:hypothetical protein